MTYHAWAGHEDGFAKEIPPGRWQVVMHHGSAYAVYVSGQIKNFMAQFAMGLLHEGAYFRGIDALDKQGGHDVDYVDHWRHLRVRERAEVQSMRGARDL